MSVPLKFVYLDQTATVTIRVTVDSSFVITESLTLTQKGDFDDSTCSFIEAPAAITAIDLGTIFDNTYKW
jgi:hypothetical protein